MKGEAHTFDSFECAIHALAPTCSHCGTRIVGHRLESDGAFYCCDHCAQKDGVKRGALSDLFTRWKLPN